MTEQASSLRAFAPADDASWQRWRLAWVLCAAHAISFVDRFVMVLVTEPVRAAFALSDTELGLLQGAGFALLYCGFAIPLGWAADVVNRRNLIVSGIILWSGATVAAAFANSFETLFLARVFVGLGEACLIPAAMSLLASYFPRRQLARGVAIFGMGAYFGNGVAFIGGGALLALLTANGGLAVPFLPHMAPWQGAFFTAGLAAIPVLLLLFTLREPARETQKNLRSQLESMRGAISHIRRNFSAYWPMFVCASCTSTMSYALVSWSTSIMVRSHGLAPAEAGMWVGVLGVVSAPVGTWLGGWLLDTMTARNVKAAPLVFLAWFALPTLLLAVSYTVAPTFALAAAALFLFSFSTMGSLPGVYLGVQMLTPDRYRGIVASVNMMIYTLAGLGVGPTLVGLLSDGFGGGDHALALALLCVEVTLAVVVWAVVFFCRDTFQAKVVRGWNGGSGH